MRLRLKKLKTMFKIKLPQMSLAISVRHPPPPYPPLKGHAVSKKCTKWEANEVEYLKYLMRLFIPKNDTLAKFHGRVGQYRTLQALVTQVKLIRKDMLGHTEQETL
jgi:hypothetical protein